MIAQVLFRMPRLRLAAKLREQLAPGFNLGGRLKPEATCCRLYEAKGQTKTAPVEPCQSQIADDGTQLDLW